MDCAAKLFDRVSQTSAYILLRYRSDVLCEKALICASIFVDWNLTRTEVTGLQVLTVCQYVWHESSFLEQYSVLELFRFVSVYGDGVTVR